VALTYATTCGGPYGTEDFVAKTGPGLFLLLLFVTPWFWGIPTALATAELSARRPVEGGYYRWARHYLGPFWGFQSGAWTLFSSFLDNALYPVLIAQATGQVFPELTPFHRWLIAVGVIWFLSYLNYRGIRMAGGAALALNIFLFLPLVWIAVAGFLRWRTSPFVPLTAAGIDTFGGVGAGLALAMWLYSGYEEVSTAAEEMENPSRNIPLALLLVTPLNILSYAVPTLAALAAVGGWQHWASGEFTAIGHELGGPLLGHWAFLGNLAANAAIFLAFLLWWSRLAWSMADDGCLPSSLAKLHDRYGTPHRILWVYAVAYSLLAALPFENLLVADMWLVGANTTLVQVSLVTACRRGETFSRPGFRVPGGSIGLYLNAAFPILSWLLLLVLTAREHVAMGLGALLMAPAIWLVWRPGEGSVGSRD
jgi:amino acid transporter